jgi:hypothetical protein
VSKDAARGVELARAFHTDVVGPLLAQAMPRLRYAAARLGSGSDVLGFDDDMSRDHDWGCRLTILVDEPDRAAVPQVRQLLEWELPETYRGLPVRFAVTWDPCVSARAEIATVSDFTVSRLGIDPTAELSVLDWLILTGQSVLEVTAGPVPGPAAAPGRPPGPPDRRAHRAGPADARPARVRLACGAGCRPVSRLSPRPGTRH